MPEPLIILFLLFAVIIAVLAYKQKDQLQSAQDFLSIPDKEIPQHTSLTTLRHFTQQHPDVDPTIEEHGDVDLSTAQTILKDYLEDDNAIYLLGFGSTGNFFQIDRDTDGSIVLVMLESSAAKFMETDPSALTHEEIQTILKRFWYLTSQAE
jgi:hypothetical protein